MSDRKPQVKKESDSITVPREVLERQKRKADDLQRFAKMLFEKAQDLQSEIKALKVI